MENTRLKMDISSYLEYELESIRDTKNIDKCKVDNDSSKTNDIQKISVVNQCGTSNTTKTLVNPELIHPQGSRAISDFYNLKSVKKLGNLNATLQHINVEHKGAQRSQQCRQCHCAFKGKGHLKRHMMTHTKGEFQNQCEKCDFISFNRAVIELHMFTHTYEDLSKENPYICDLCKCECKQ